MASEIEHLNKATHNENYYLSFNLDNTPYLDWVVNGIFYSAIHYIESYLAMQARHPKTHGERNSCIRDDDVLGRYIFRNYMALKDDSEYGRYYMKTFTPVEIRQFIIPRLYAIKEYLKKYIPEIKLA